MNTKKVPKEEMGRLIQHLEAEMDLASINLEFEKAAELRDEVEELRLKFSFKKDPALAGSFTFLVCGPSGLMLTRQMPPDYWLRKGSIALKFPRKLRIF